MNNSGVGDSVNLRGIGEQTERDGAERRHALVIKGQNAGQATPPLACAALPDWQRLPPTG